MEHADTGAADCRGLTGSGQRTGRKSDRGHTMPARVIKKPVCQFSIVASLDNQTDATMLDKTGFNERLVQVLAQRVAAKKKAAAGHGRMFGVALALAGAIGCFFVLKGATLAYFGHEDFAAMMAPVSDAGGFAGLRYWLAGPDPLSGTIAMVFNPAH